MSFHIAIVSKYCIVWPPHDIDVWSIMVCFNGVETACWNCSCYFNPSSKNTTLSLFYFLYFFSTFGDFWCLPHSLPLIWMIQLFVFLPPPKTSFFWPNLSSFQPPQSLHPGLCTVSSVLLTHFVSHSHLLPIPRPKLIFIFILVGNFFSLPVYSFLFAICSSLEVPR